MTGNQEFMLYDGLISLVGNMLWYVVLIIVCWLIYRARRNADNKNAEIMMKAIETNSTVDADKLINALSQPRKSPEQIRQRYLLCGCIGTFIGLGAIVINVICISMYGGNNRYYTLTPVFPVLLMFVAGISLAVGMAYMTVFFASRKNSKSNKE
ncbi:MAG: hypothetical protein HDS04_05370 [Bacteroides sp.]|nr:hypothetical protein [Bacteroides sp.]